MNAVRICLPSLSHGCQTHSFFFYALLSVFSCLIFGQLNVSSKSNKTVRPDFVGQGRNPLKKRTFYVSSFLEMLFRVKQTLPLCVGFPG